MKMEQLIELLYQALETEQGGIQVYETALRCVVNEELKEEWQEYLEQTRRHERTVRRCSRRSSSIPKRTRRAVWWCATSGSRWCGPWRWRSMSGNPEAAQLVAAECVVEAETKDHLNWELLHQAAEAVKGEKGKALKQAVEDVEEDEDEHLYHTQGWTRELWIAALGLPAVLPPPEEEREVKTAIGAARAKQARKEML